MCLRISTVELKRDAGDIIAGTLVDDGVTAEDGGDGGV